MSEPATAILVFAHGSAVEEANREVARLAEEVARQAQCPARCAFLELAQPDLRAAVTELVSAGARRIIVIPYFLTMGVHMRRDLPRLIEEQRARFPGVEIRAGHSLEGSPAMVHAVLERAQETLNCSDE